MSLRSIFDVLLELSGVSMLALALLHLYFARLLGWSADLRNLKPINAQVFNAHTIFLVGGITLLGLSCICFAAAMTARTTLGAVAAGCFALCWLSRLICQFVLFKAPFCENTRLEFLLRLLGALIWCFYTGLFAALFAFQIGVIGN